MNVVAEFGGIGDRCAICRDEMQEQDSLRRIDCGHLFHNQCLSAWEAQQSLGPRKFCCYCKQAYEVPVPCHHRVISAVDRAVTGSFYWLGRQVNFLRGTGLLIHSLFGLRQAGNLWSMYQGEDRAVSTRGMVVQTLCLMVHFLFVAWHTSGYLRR